MKKVIKVSEETYNKIKGQLDIEDVVSDPTLDEHVGNNVFVSSENGSYVGKLESTEGGFIKLSSASQVAIRGRLATVIAEGNLEEVDIVGSCSRNISKVMDIIPWNHPLPTENK